MTIIPNGFSKQPIEIQVAVIRRIITNTPAKERMRVIHLPEIQEWMASVGKEASDKYKELLLVLNSVPEKHKKVFTKLINQITENLGE